MRYTLGFLFVVTWAVATLMACVYGNTIGMWIGGLLLAIVVAALAESRADSRRPPW